MADTFIVDELKEDAQKRVSSSLFANLDVLRIFDVCDLSEIRKF